MCVHCKYWVALFQHLWQWPWSWKPQNLIWWHDQGFGEKPVTNLPHKTSLIKQINKINQVKTPGKQANKQTYLKPEWQHQKPTETLTFKSSNLKLLSRAYKGFQFLSAGFRKTYFLNRRMQLKKKRNGKNQFFRKTEEFCGWEDVWENSHFSALPY